MSDDLLQALGQADANMYLCSEDLRPSESPLYFLFLWLLYCWHFCIYADIIFECKFFHFYLHCNVFTLHVVFNELLFLIYVQL